MSRIFSEEENPRQSAKLAVNCLFSACSTIFCLHFCLSSGLLADIAQIVHVSLMDERFVRLNVEHSDVALKIEMINDEPAHVGDITTHPTLGHLDSAENILANKITALIGREEPKDLADIWGFCCQMGLQISDAIEDAHSKAAGIFPADLARVLCSVTYDDWRLINWFNGPQPEVFIEQLNSLGEQLIIPLDPHR